MKKVCVALAFFAALCANIDGREINEHFSVNISERFRLTTWDNATVLNPYVDFSRTFTRYRSSVEGIYKQANRFAFHLKLTHEFRQYLHPRDDEIAADEVFFDNLFLYARPFDRRPISFTVGRQNLILDEGFIMMDGTPLDGSRSIYFNAARVDWRFGERHTLTGFVCHQEVTDDFLPLINDVDRSLVEQPETGVGLYYKRPVSQADLSLYVVHKNSEGNVKYPDDQYVTCVGGRFAYPFGEGHRFVFEGALQDGRIEPSNSSAYGGYLYVDIAPSAKTDPWYIPRLLSVGTIALSGDDLNSSDYEGWNPMFARWPKWSESYIYTLVNENGVAYWSNLFSVYGVIGFDLTSHIESNIVFYRMKALEPTDGSLPFPGGNGKTRGNLVIVHVGYTIDARWSGHIHWESFYPGDFYFDGAVRSTWIRAELMFRY